MHRKLLAFLRKTVSAFQAGDIFGLKEIANHAIEDAAMENDRELARIALVSYCLHKMGSKQHMVRHDRWQEIKHDILFDLKKAAKSIERNDEEGFLFSLNAAIDSVQLTDKRMGNYAQSLFEKAKVKYASNAYSMGLGLGQAAELTGAEKKAVLRYVGQTRIADKEFEGAGIGERLRRLKEKLGGGTN